jgi:sec-independent protein translocase protein TatC
MLFLAFGIVMEFPIILVLLSKVGIVTSKRLRSSRRMAVLGVVIFSAVITPGADLVSPIVMAMVMYGLYEISIVMIRIGGR